MTEKKPWYVKDPPPPLILNPAYRLARHTRCEEAYETVRKYVVNHRR